jgi:HD-GYP domain-containing protein (c-di-GMP phosphodiesterase class II)
VFDHRDTLGRLNDHIPLREKLITAHNSIKELFPFVARIAVTIYDPQTSVLKTFLHSSDDGDPMQHYQASLDDAPSLKEILKQGLPRVVNNLVTFEGGEHEHTRRIGRQGYAASYTMPMFNDGVFVGFLFFNSYDRDVFTEHVLREIDVYGHMIALMVINELTSIRTLTAAVQTTGHITHVRDAETGSHLDRMSRYCRLIATALAPKYLLDDDYIEHVFMFSPLHDIGKIGIPDRILLKPDKLNDEEWEIMKTHARKGREMIDKIVSNFGLENFRHMDVLRNIAEHHHECVNGSGYPAGRTRDQIPLEARIVAVADVFDALTSARPYKEAWDNGRAIAMLRQLTGDRLDADCVEALIENMDKVEEIQRQFAEDPYG